MKKFLLLTCLLVTFVLTGCQPSEVPSVEPTEEPVEVTAVPETTQSGEATENTAETDAAETAQEPAKAYVIVTAHGYVYEPIPLYGEGRFRLTFGEHVNVVEVTEDSVKMAESTCDNQDCVEQGTVTLENRSKRVLQNMIICLPNDVALELYTYEEMLAVVEGYMGGQAE